MKKSRAISINSAIFGFNAPSISLFLVIATIWTLVILFPQTASAITIVVNSTADPMCGNGRPIFQENRHACWFENIDPTSVEVGFGSTIQFDIMLNNMQHIELSNQVTTLGSYVVTPGIPVVLNDFPVQASLALTGEFGELITPIIPLHEPVNVGGFGGSIIFWNALKPIVEPIEEFSDATLHGVRLIIEIGESELEQPVELITVMLSPEPVGSNPSIDFLDLGNEDSVIALTITTNQDNADLGQSVSEAGDINGDGFPDLIAGLPSFSAGQTRGGVARLYQGTPNGISSDFQQLEANQAEAQFGFSVAGVGDLNNDGFDDVAIGAPLHDGTQNDQGAVYIYLGSASGLQTPPVRRLEGNNAGARLGTSLAGAGDLNNDGFADLIAGMPGFIDLSQGAQAKGPSPLGAILALLGNLAQAIRDNPNLVTVPSSQPDSGFGTSVAGGGDINGDGMDDVIVGSPTADADSGNKPNAGAIDIFTGAPTGLVADPLRRLLGAVAERRFGTDVAIVDDVNRDGFADYAIGAPGRSKSQSEDGEVAVYLGNTNPSPTPVVTLQSGRQNDEFGTSITSIPDVSGDGVRELVVGAPRHTAEDPEEGAAYVFVSHPDQVYVETPRFIFEGNQPNANLGRDVSAIDLDERRSKRGNPLERNFAELALGAPQLNNSGGVLIYQLSSEELSGPGGGGSLLIDDFEQ